MRGLDYYQHGCRGLKLCLSLFMHMVLVAELKTIVNISVFKYSLFFRSTFSTLYARLPPLGSLVHVCVTPYRFRGGQN